MKRKVVIKIGLVIVLSLFVWRWYYNIHYKKDNHQFTKKLSVGLYEEVFLLSSGGVLGSDLYSCYLTDSMSYRKFIGRFDNKEKYVIEQLNSDTIKAIKYSRRIHYGSSVPIDSVTYSIKELKREGKF